MDDPRSNVQSISENLRAAPDVPDRCNVLNIKEELGDAELDFKPPLQEYADIDDTSDQNESVGTDENMMDDEDDDPILRSRVKEESDSQHSEEETQPEQRAQLYTCDKCQMVYSSRENLRNHCRQVHGAESHKCTECSKEFKCQAYLVSHVLYKHREQPYKCVVCKAMCRSSEALNKHIARHHGDVSADSQHSKEETQTEQRAAPQLYSCLQCQMVCSSKANLSNHCRQAHGTESLKCTECKKEFKCKAYLESHVFYKHREQPYKCVVCKVICRSGEALNAHVARFHARVSAGSHQIKEEIQPEQRAQPQIYSCLQCQKVYSSKQNLKNHCRQTHGTESLKCTECDKEFKCKAYLDSHILYKHREQPYKCVVCKVMCRSREALDVHVGRYHAHVSAEHQSNDTLNTREAPMMEHSVSEQVEVQSHSEKTIKAEVEDVEQPAKYIEIEVDVNCVKEEPGLVEPFKNEAGLSLKEEVEADSSQAVTDAQPSAKSIQLEKRTLAQSFNCEKCAKTFNSKESFRKHVNNVHSKKQFECDVCKKIFKSKAGLNSHVLVHRRPAGFDAPLYSCTQCIKTFNSKGNLGGHYRRVHGKESHKCTKCNKQYKCKAYLQMHINNVHSVQQFECAICKAIYKTKLALSSHFGKYHTRKFAVTSPVVFTCDYCQKIYNRKHGLEVHIESMHAKVFHRCSECKVDLKSKHYLKNHIRIMHSKEKHGCEFCEKVFRNKYYYNRHVRSMHCEKSAATSEHSGSLQQTTFGNSGKESELKWNCQQLETSGKSSRPAVGDPSAEASTSTGRPDVVVVKEEPADGELDLGPVVFQHVDSNYRPCKGEPQLD